VDVQIAILALAVLALVVRFITGPLRERSRYGGDGGGAPGAEEPPPEPPAARDVAEVQALEAAREAKYREIRDCELDFRTGKLSRADYEAIDGQLRAEAIEILNRLERAREARPAEDGASSP
jgi:hypothetical protein